MSYTYTSRLTPPKSASDRGRGWIMWVSVLGLCLAALSGTYLLFVEAPPPKKVVIATGGKTGAYYQFAQKYAAELRKEGLTVEVRESKGSVENLQLLQDPNSGVDIAIVQSGVAKVEDCENLRALGSLYREPLWVFYRSDAPIDRISQLEGKRIGVGPPGSGTHAIALQMLAANGLMPDTGAKAVLATESVTAAAQALRRGELDAAFFVAALEADYIKELLRDGSVRLLSLAQHEAYHRRFRFLSEVTVPKGLIDLGANLPSQDIALVAPTAMLATRTDFHPALVSLFLNAATRIHGKGDELSNPGEFPCAAYTDFPISDDAKHFFKSGPPVLQRLLPFWLASLVDRLKVMLIPMMMLLMPALRAAPPLARWRARRRIYLWYAALRDVDKKLFAGLTGAELEHEIARLHDLEQAISMVHVPLSYSDELYHLRLHIKMIQTKLHELHAQESRPGQRLAALRGAA